MSDQLDSKQRDWRQRAGKNWLLLPLLIFPLWLAACRQADKATIVVTEVVFLNEPGEASGTEAATLQAEQTSAPTVTPNAEVVRDPVTLDLSFIGGFPEIDPQKAETPEGIDLVENLFVGLTNYNTESAQIDPELAREWEVSSDGRVWTFHLRDDVYWVRPVNSSGEAAVGVAEPVRQVVAADVEYAIRRVCHRNTRARDAFILFIIVGCAQAYESADARLEAAEVDGVRALDDFTLQITLKEPASYFLTISSMPLLHPVPRELVQNLGEEWLTPTNLITSGPFFPLPRSASDTKLILHQSPLWPIQRTGNIDIVNILFLNDELSAYQLWQAKSLDISPLPAQEREALLSRSPARAALAPEQTVFFLGYNFSSGAFREPEVRQAFDAAIDRERLVQEILDGRALPMRHLEPPGVVAAPPIDQVGTGYSPDLARQLMGESGFRSCRLMPQITFLVTTSDLSLRQAELIRSMWVDELGCSEGQIVIEQVEFGTLLANTRQDAGRGRPDIWELGWASYYPDAHNWVGDLLHCTESENRQNRPCSEVDVMIKEAAATIDPVQRLLTYREIESLFFSDDGSKPLSPLYVRGDYVLNQSWLSYTPALAGGEQYDTYVIDEELKRLERSR